MSVGNVTVRYTLKTHRIGSYCVLNGKVIYLYPPCQKTQIWGISEAYSVCLFFVAVKFDKINLSCYNIRKISQQILNLTNAKVYGIICATTPPHTTFT